MADDRLTLRIDPELRSRLDAAAVAQDRSVAWVVRRALEEALGARSVPSYKGRDRPSMASSPASPRASSAVNVGRPTGADIRQARKLADEAVEGGEPGGPPPSGAEPDAKPIVPQRPAVSEHIRPAIPKKDKR